jgi:uncharacterized coiled-coil DUF342 family protein
MTNSPEDPRPSALGDLSVQQLNSLLRRASNQVEILAHPDAVHASDEEERQRIKELSEDARASIYREAMKTIVAVREEFRRRGDDQKGGVWLPEPGRTG